MENLTLEQAIEALNNHENIEVVVDGKTSTIESRLVFSVTAIFISPVTGSDYFTDAERAIYVTVATMQDGNESLTPSYTVV